MGQRVRRVRDGTNICFSYPHININNFALIYPMQFVVFRMLYSIISNRRMYIFMYYSPTLSVFVYNQINKYFLKLIALGLLQLHESESPEYLRCRRNAACISMTFLKHSHCSNFFYTYFLFFYIFFFCVSVWTNVSLSLLYLGLLQLLLCRLDIYYYLFNYFFTSLVCVTVWIDICFLFIFLYIYLSFWIAFNLSNNYQAHAK